MKFATRLLIIALLVFLGGAVFDVSAQCVQKIKVGGIRANNTAGEFKLNIQQAGAFSGKLIRIDGTKESVVQSFSGPGSKEIAFSNLNLDPDFYRVVVEFASEQKFLCKSKTVDVDFH